MKMLQIQLLLLLPQKNTFQEFNQKRKSLHPNSKKWQL